MAEKGISPRQARFIAALLEGKAVATAAREAKVSDRQAARYMAAPVVRAELRRLQDETLAQVTRQLAAGMGAAVTALLEIAKKPGAPESARVSAAGKLLDSGLRFTETADLAQRVADLEKQLTGGETDGEPTDASA